jgi:ABC-type multidrug transport system fused ATPase/permease subunit
METDTRIQLLTRSLKCTVLLIAHRLSSVMSLDRVMLLEHGQIKEMDTPKKLIQQNGLFAALVAQSDAQ